ncbi:dihydrolipoamide dehydrogenase [Thermotomaculum hydrothermale]|uniref:Dihydrolipoyl dehydrogenase n=2 Tax=Thermotomaculum hydrothermale TaxID=981385 RepID=A0A7R6PY34_9BACT|nr:dihydrolipoamide dehydrogenase [Thermotomaculum hydrothermale]
MEKIKVYFKGNEFNSKEFFMANYDIVIIGAGPGGYVAAIYAAKNGLKTAIVEKGDRLGGTCLNIGCIPTKAYIETAKYLRKIKFMKELGIEVKDFSFDFQKASKRKDRIVTKLTKGVELLMKNNNIEVIKGTASFKDNTTIEVNGEEIEFENCIIATGSKPAELPHITFDGDFVISSTEALSFDKLPESIAIIGGGVIGVEFASILSAFGVKVTVLELMPQLIPGMDSETAEILKSELKKQKVRVLTDAKVLSAKNGVVEYELNGERESIEVEKVLLAVGRKPNTSGLNLHNTDIVLEKGHIRVNENLETDVKAIYAIGDVIDTPRLAHLASREGIKAVNHILKIEDNKNIYLSCPGVVYSYPEAAFVGMSLDDAKEKGIDAEEAKFPFTANGKAYIEGVKNGFVKVVYQKNNEKLLGVHIVGANASELISECAVAISKGMNVEELSRVIHPHPTVSESLMEAFHIAAGYSIHI